MRRNLKILLVLAGAISVLSFGIYHYDKTHTAFELACSERLLDRKYSKSQAGGLCEKLEKKFFFGRNPIQEISPGKVGAPVLPIDDKVRFVTFYDPAYLSSFAYCYFAFRGWFDPSSMSPKRISLAASGFAILKSELFGYSDWLKSAKGVECVKSLAESIGLGATDLEAEMRDRVSVIAFNPVGAIRSDDGMDSVLKEAVLTINHERIHAIHVSCPEVDEAAVKHWDALSLTEREKLKENHLNYDWNNRTVAVREAFAYFLEDQPLKVLEYSKKCF